MMQLIDSAAWLIEPAVILLTCYFGYKIVTRRGKNATDTATNS